MEVIVIFKGGKNHFQGWGGGGGWSNIPPKEAEKISCPTIDHGDDVTCAPGVK